MMKTAAQKQKRHDSPQNVSRNQTGIPAKMKQGFEAYSGFCFDDVRVHYHSSEPSKVYANAFARGNEVFLASGQDSCLPHELGHIVQQKSGRVKADIQCKGRAVNIDESMEREADAIALRALRKERSQRMLQHAKTGIPVIQRSRWLMEKTGWKCITKDAVKASPKIQGKLGDIFDDVLNVFLDPMTLKPLKKVAAAQAPAVRTRVPAAALVRPPIPAPAAPPAAARIPILSPLHIRALAPASAPVTAPAPLPAPAPASMLPRDLVRENEGEMLNLIQRFTQGEELNEREQQSLTTWLSNAGYLLRRIYDLSECKSLDTSQWEEALEAFRSSAGLSVFTRDVDLGELKGQPFSGGTMSTVLRMIRGIGRIRSYADLNRGGGAGSYVRLVAEKKKPSATEASHPLNMGGIAKKAGITILYDAVSVMEDNKGPAHMAFNKQDSAGRVFGTSVDSEQELKAMRRFSSNVLSKANPDYMGRPIGARIPDLSDELLMENAEAGVQEMVRQMMEGQTPKEEYNEAILFQGAKISRIKAILIHTPIAAVGRPGVMTPFKPTQIARAQRRADTASADKEATLYNLRLQFDQYARDIAEGRITRVHGERLRSDILKRIAMVEKTRIPEVRLRRVVPHPEPSTTKKLRMKHVFEHNQIPDELKPWENETGHRGVPIRYLIQHITPDLVTRSELPAIAQAVWLRGYAAWQHDLHLQRILKKDEEHMRMQAETLSVEGRSLAKLQEALRIPLPPASERSHELSELEESNMLYNNCLINAVSNAVYHQNATPQQIHDIRILLRDLDLAQIGEMLYASENILQIICSVLGIERPIQINYYLIPPEIMFQYAHGAPVQVYHRGAHFSHMR